MLNFSEIKIYCKNFLQKYATTFLLVLSAKFLKTFCVFRPYFENIYLELLLKALIFFLSFL